MPSEVMNQWFNSRKPAQIEGLKLTLRPHSHFKNIPLSSQQGQAEVFFSQAEDSSSYILKCFHDGKCPEITYLNAVSTLLPRHNAFRCGTERKVLSKQSLKKGPGFYAAPKLAAYLENSILMPQIDGLDWHSLNDALRKGKRTLSGAQRLRLCSNLAGIVKLLEEHQISHRDLSGGNVFIDPDTLHVSLIDLDSLYHPSLKMPEMTTIGSEGYTVPFASANNPAATYCPCADRFALTILCVEFLILDSTSPFCHEGGIFEQNDLNRRQGKTLSHAVSKLKTLHPNVLKRLNATIKSRTYKDCPAPQEWIIKDSITAKAPSLESLPQVRFASFRPRDIHVVKLPENPWNNLKGELKNGTASPCVTVRRSPLIKPVRPLDLDGSAQVYLRTVANPVAGTVGKSRRTLLKKGLGFFPLFNLLGFWKNLF
jgi:serine/threonine protein kinase